MDARPRNTEQLELLTDLELIAEINHGGEDAFAVLYHRHKEWVANLAYRWTGDRELALDVLQETFFYFARKFPGFSLTAKFHTFLYPVVRNLSISARRKTDRFQSEGIVPEAAEQAAPPTALGDEENLRAALAGLSEEHREVLWLRFVDGLSLQEIAMAMEIPLGTVKSRLHHGLETLRQDERTKKSFEE